MAERNAAALDVDFGDDHRDFVALLKHLAGLADAPGPGHVRDVHQAVDIVLDLDKGAEVGQAAHRALERGTGGILSVERLPGIVLGLLHAQRDLLVFAVYFEHHYLDDVSDIDQLGWVSDVLGPRHLGDMHQALNTLFQLDESAVVGNRDDLAADLRIDGVLLFNVLPRVSGQLLET